MFLLIFDRCVFHKKRKKVESKMDVWPLPKLMEYHRCLWPHKTLQFSAGRGPYKQWQKVLPISGGHNFAAFCYARIMLWPSAAGLMTPHPHIGWIICLLEVRVEYFRSTSHPHHTTDPFEVSLVGEMISDIWGLFYNCNYKNWD